MLRHTFLFVGQIWQLFEVSQILEFLRYACLYERTGSYCCHPGMGMGMGLTLLKFYVEIF